MALVRAERVLQSSTTNGTGSLTLGDPVAGFRSFASVMSNGDTCYYAAVRVSQAGRPLDDWEVGLGTLTNATTFARTTVLQSSNGGNAVDFQDGLKYVFLTFTAVETADLYSKVISVDLPTETALATDDYMVFTDTSASNAAKKITVADVLETVDDRVSNLLVAGTNISLNYNDAGNALTINSTVSVTPPTMQVITSSTTWNRPSGCKKIKVVIVGGGGGGGYAIGNNTNGNSAAGGGGAGAMAIKWIDVTAISSVSVTIGAGGAAKTSNSSDGLGNNGGTSSFGTHCSAGGGSGGIGANGSSFTNMVHIGAGGSGGSATNGDINVKGANGITGMMAWISSSIRNASGGSGGNSAFGSGGRGAISVSGANTVANAIAVDGYGAGGAGGGSATSTGSNGLAGAGGICVVEEYY